jgi:hypothetical protein
MAFGKSMGTRIWETRKRRKIQRRAAIKIVGIEKEQTELAVLERIKNGGEALAAIADEGDDLVPITESEASS